MATKSAKALILGLYWLCLLSPPGASAQGDLNNDGDLGHTDLLLFVRHVSGAQPLDPGQLAEADLAPVRTGGDGVVNGADLFIFIRNEMLFADADGDGVLGEKRPSNTPHPFLPDTDGDGLCDGPVVGDGDQGVCSGGEWPLGTNPLRVDTDGDGLCDGPDRGAQSDPTGSCTSGEDLDADGVIEAGETNPVIPNP